MIKISNNEMTSDTLINELQPSDLGKKIINILTTSSETYQYNSIEQLKFELNLRSSIVDNAVKLYKGRLRFRIFRESECNKDYWERTDDGGFLLKEGVKPSDAINDIFKNTSKYGTECATAMVIIFYKAVLDLYQEDLFNKLLPKIYLMNWQNTDDLLGVFTYRDPVDYLPGDCIYFINPDVDPLTPEWQGENTIDLGNGLYYGHGIGINKPEQIIDALNENRISGSTTSAYMLKSATRLNFKGLYKQYEEHNTTG